MDKIFFDNFNTYMHQTIKPTDIKNKSKETIKDAHYVKRTLRL